MDHHGYISSITASDNPRPDTVYSTAGKWLHVIKVVVALKET